MTLLRYFLYTMFFKKEPFIFENNFRIFWSISIFLEPVETGINTRQYDAILLISLVNDVITDTSQVMKVYFSTTQAMKNVPLYV